MDLRKAISSAVARTRRSIRRRIASLWHYPYLVQYRFAQYRLRYGGIAVSAVLLLLLLVSIYLAPSLQAALESHYDTEDAVQAIQRLLLNTGTALIGAAAIVTSLVLFAMQVNIERMPHGLFRRLSADRRLLGAFAIAFLLAIGVATLSTFAAEVRIAYVVLSAAWAVILVLLLFLYAYRRALVLINPLQQLGILVQDTRKGLRLWDRRARRAMPLLEPDRTETTKSSPTNSTPDLSRTAYFQINNRWTDGAARGVQHAMSFARRYAEQGDYEVSRSALTAVVAINGAYIEAKGKTFYANPPLMEDPRSRDPFITDTLEYMRQHVQSGITRRDEQQIEQTLQALGTLVRLYQGIDYSSTYATKSHAHLAAAYLANAVQAVVPHDMADVLLEGVRLMGRSAQQFLVHGKPNEIATLSQKIASIACVGCVKEDYRPVTMEGMAQLANLTFDVLLSKSRDIHFSIGEIRRNVALISQLFLKVLNPLLSNIHDTYLGPYYSSTSTESLRFRLTALVNDLSNAQSDNTDAKSIIRNIEQWADGLYQPTKDLLLAAISAKSHFTISMIQWIAGMTEILLELSNAPACERHSQEELLKHARWLIGTLTWVPDDEESVTFVETFQLTEALFEAAMNARDRDCNEVSREIGEHLLSWTFKGGRYITGWGVLESGLCACAAFALIGNDDDVNALRANIRKHVHGDHAPEQKVLQHGARGIRERAARLTEPGHWSSRIETTISQMDYGTLSPLLEEIANILSPPAI